MEEGKSDIDQVGHLKYKVYLMRFKGNRRIEIKMTREFHLIAMGNNRLKAKFVASQIKVHHERTVFRIDGRRNKAGHRGVGSLSSQ